MLHIRKSWKLKQIIILVCVAFSWEFSFPQHVAAATRQPVRDEIIRAAAAAQEQVAPPAPPQHLPELTNKPQPVAKRTIRVTVTAYSSTVDQCGSTPFTTASGTTVRDGIIAANFLPIGTKVRFPQYFGSKVFVVEDRMSPRYWQRADIWMPTRQLAKEWGVRSVTMEIL
ncbi:MAG: 3D domain-containing protein [Patescibacteria group bacterium]